MKRAGGGYDYSYNAHTAVDETAQIVVAAELSNNAADSDRLPVLLAAVKAEVAHGSESIGMAAEVAHGSCTDVPPARK